MKLNNDFLFRLLIVAFFALILIQLHRIQQVLNAIDNQTMQTSAAVESFKNVWMAHEFGNYGVSKK